MKPRKITKLVNQIVREHSNKAIVRRFNDLRKNGRRRIAYKGMTKEEALAVLSNPKIALEGWSLYENTSWSYDFHNSYCGTVRIFGIKKHTNR